jgi:hypothetical protein
MKQILRLHRITLLSCLLGAVVGCAPKEEIEELKVLPVKGPEFKGSVDSSIVGLWKSTDDKMHLMLDKDGNARMQATVGTRNGPQKIDNKMEWKVDGETISFKDQNEAVSQYKFKLKGEELRLSSPKSLTIYVREK